MISEAYRALNWQMLRADRGYGRGGDRHAETVLAFADEMAAASVLDYGCGQGRLRLALWEFGYSGMVREYDPCIPKKATPPKRADLVVCTDVLEHVEPDQIDAVLGHLRTVAKKAAFLSIATRPSNKTLPDGRNAHLIVERATWWVRKIRKSAWRLHRLKLGYRKGTTDLRGVQLWLTTTRRRG